MVIMKNLGCRSLVISLLLSCPFAFAQSGAPTVDLALPATTELNFQLELLEPAEEKIRVQEVKQKNSNAHVQVIKNAPITDNLKTFSTRSPWRKGILITVTSATSFATSYFLFSHDLNLSAKLFGVAMVVNGYQVLATSSWQKLLRRGGVAAKKAMQWSARMIGKSIEAGRISDGVGRLITAMSFNTGVAGIILGLNGALDSALMIATMGALGTWDSIWDLAVDRQVEKGKLSQDQFNKIIRYRLTAAPPVEAVAYSASSFAPAAVVTMAVVGTAGLVSYFAEEKLSEWLEFKSHISCKRLLGKFTSRKIKSPDEEPLYVLDTSDIN